MHHIEHEFRLVDTMREEHKLSEEFNAVSPIQEIPCITEGSYKIISGPCQFMFYLCNTRSIVKDSLYPKDCERMINRHIAWYQNKLRPKTQKLIKMLQRQLQEENNLLTRRGSQEAASRSSSLRTSSMSAKPQNVEFELDAIKQLLDQLDTQLRSSNAKYFGNTLSIADILYFWELCTLQHLLKREIVPANTELATWFYESMKHKEEIRQIDQKALEALAQYDQSRRGAR